MKNTANAFDLTWYPHTVTTPKGEELVMAAELDEPTRVMSKEQSDNLRHFARMRPTAPSLVFKSDKPVSSRPPPEDLVTVVNEHEAPTRRVPS